MWKEGIIVLTTLVAAIVMTIGAQWFIRARSCSCRSACINNLRQLDGAVQQWALDNKKTADDIPTLAEVQPYLKNPLVCSEGGTYRLGPAREVPKCSSGVGSHVLE